MRSRTSSLHDVALLRSTATRSTSIATVEIRTSPVGIYFVPFVGGRKIARGSLLRNIHRWVGRTTHFEQRHISIRSDKTNDLLYAEYDGIC